MPMYRFDYPEAFRLHEEYRAHSGQIVEVVRPLTRDEYTFEGEAMFLIRASCGWEGQVWRSELTKVS